MSLGARPLRDFARSVGDRDAVVPVGGRTQWGAGGEPDPSAREVRPPSGVVSSEPAEMVVRVRAGTPVAELADAVGASGQMVPLDPPSPTWATVGGVLSVGQSGLRRLRWGPIRDTVLEVTYVSAEGKLVRAGGPVVKNVSGFDLCRLMVGSLGTIGILAEVVLRTLPAPKVAVWMTSTSAPWEIASRAFRPSSVLWDGRSTRVLLEGDAGEVASESEALGSSFEECGPPERVPPERISVRPSKITTAVAGMEPGSFLAEIGVGVIHLDGPVTPPPTDASAAALHRRIKEGFDPNGRLNPGRRVVLA